MIAACAVQVHPSRMRDEKREFRRVLREQFANIARADDVSQVTRCDIVLE